MKIAVALSCILVSWSCNAFELIAHRANAQGALENSIEGVKASWASGADIVEIDVRLSLDRVVYLFHDDEIDGKPVSAMNYAEVERLTSKERVPRLESVLNVDGAKGRYLLDLKSPSSDDIERLAVVVESSSFPAERIIVQSDNLAVLGQASKVLPNCQLFYLDRLNRKPPFYRRPSPKKIVGKIAGVGVHGISLKGRRAINSEYVESLKMEGLKVYIWTINNSGRIKYYRRIGADGVFTDRIEEMRKRNITN